ncbi:phosphopantothenoylcysteine decarboxylase [Piedraia hortae CBS 480.64]|uniref:Phosphopantothenoylcysteine decarboxylase n=1 Tax=Piedraia hortae CBS 480.64 TaxID=1314780 RepID=A0A6A7C930_9PEZI|nr:phosphopantothenoylcysteine decarboxylase [Piedraia hortae CBS 480.64]
MPFTASDETNDGKYHLLLAATGSVATIKLPNIIMALGRHENVSIRVMLSESAVNFLQGQSEEQPTIEQIAKMKNVVGIHRDADEWQKPWVRGDPIMHIELRRWADLLVIAPLSANSLAKIAHGFSDSLITSVVRAWDVHGLIDSPRPNVPRDAKRIMVAPAMNTAMWHHPLTTEHVEKLGSWVTVLQPIEKTLACGDTGSGAMHDWNLIVLAIEQALFK